MKHDDEAVYLVSETKDTKDFLKLRSGESDKVRCGERHFEAIGVPFAVAVTAERCDALGRPWVAGVGAPLMVRVPPSTGGHAP